MPAAFADTNVVIIVGRKDGDNMEKVECAVIGAGVVGLAIARELALQGHEVVVLEKSMAIGTETSSRSSEVIHAGIYYQPNSWKARLCVAGKVALYRYCEEHEINHKRCGKLIVAKSDGEIDRLWSLQESAIKNGVNDLQRLNGTAALSLEPELNCVAALLSPSTGIIDSHSLMFAYQGDLEAHGGVIAFGSEVRGGRIRDDSIVLELGGLVPLQLSCSMVVNSAGLYAADITRKICGYPKAQVPETYFCKGNYFTLSGRAPFKHLIYPLPNAASLGIHLTFDLGGQVRFGPDLQWVDEVDYDVDPERVNSFYHTVREYWPALPDGALSPGYAGIRPKTSGPDGPIQDFEIEGPSNHGIAGLVNLFAIESPGITASLAIAESVTKLLKA